MIHSNEECDSIVNDVVSQHHHPKHLKIKDIILQKKEICEKRSKKKWNLPTKSTTNE